MEIKLKATKWQVAGRVVLALIGVYAATLATSTATSSASKDSLEQMVSQLNTIVIPAIQKLLEELRYDAKQDRDDDAAVRERVARLEGILESMSGKKGTAKPKGMEPWGFKKIMDNATKKAAAKKETRLPTVRLQYQQLGPNLETAIKE